ncbi:MAG: hypothetical protein OXC99_11645 [Chloroflexi bacterium]|nr:hypothetical protein [Chloroflexota bacterium]
MASEEKKTCFVIAPIGDTGSEIRERSDLVLEHIIRPAVEPLGYEAFRADEIDDPGIITSQVIQQVLDSDLVVADLTERNPNVFYELAIRHLIRKPFIQLVREGDRIPFDVAGTRTIFVDHTNLASAAEAIGTIRKQIQSLESGTQDLDTPISTAVDLQRLRQSEVPQERSLAEILSNVAEMRAEISNLAESLPELSEGGGRRELQALSENVYRKVEEISAFAQPPRSRAPLVPTRGLERLIVDLPPPYKLLMASSVFQESAPWLYALGIEAYRYISAGNDDNAREILRVMMATIRSTGDFAPTGRRSLMLLESIVSLILNSIDDSPF